MGVQAGMTVGGDDEERMYLRVQFYKDDRWYTYCVLEAKYLAMAKHLVCQLAKKYSDTRIVEVEKLDGQNCSSRN